MSNIYTSADQLIGKTPLLELTHIEKDAGLNARLLVKLEDGDILRVTEEELLRFRLREGMDLDGETLAKIMYPQSAEFLNKVSERDEAEREEILIFLAGYLSGGSEEGKTYYEGFLHELDGGFRAGDLTAGGRAAWERLRDFVSRFAASAEPEA